MARYRELKKLLSDNEFIIKKWFGKESHEIWIHPTGVRTTITRHSSDVSKIVERSILKAIKETKGDRNE